MNKLRKSHKGVNKWRRQEYVGMWRKSQREVSRWERS